MPKDYYLILGITSDASVDDIKDAYRKLAKEYHPDRYGNNHSPFLAIQEAYSVLSDPIKRQIHDLDVLGQKNKLRPGYKRGRSDRTRQVEPLIPERASQGRRVKVLLPVELTCPSCSGQGWIGAYECRRCSGDGFLSGEYPVMIGYPLGTSNNQEIRILLNRYGIRTLQMY